MPTNEDAAKSSSRVLDESFFYPQEELSRPQLQGEMSRDLVAFSALLGFDSKKRNNLHYLDDHTLLTSAGNSAQLIHMATMQSKHVFGLGGGGVGAIAVHPSRGFFAVGDKGNKPNITIYVYPSLKVFRVLRQGTERAYCSLRFSNDGAKLASVGASPDFLLTVWNWRDEQTILRCKAFGQEVFNVQFAPNDGGFLTTSGTGHIRFWKMASTFTGLKLQGDIAKFGKSELSDIEAFCVLPDKKVLSSTERGALLLWDGNFIKCEIVTFNRQRAHKGPINVVQYEPAFNQILTAGSDGMMKWWHFPEIDQADVKEDDTVAEVIPKDEFCVSVKSPHHTSTVADIRGVLRGSDHYLIQDGNGMLHRLDIDTKQLTHLAEGHAGAITGLATSPVEHIAATCGSDSTVRCWNYAATSSTCMYIQHFNAPATALTFAPPAHDATGRTIAVAFQDGVVRILDRGPSNWRRLHVIKPHSQPITCMAYSPNGKYFVTASQDNTLFIFACTTSTSKYEPVGFKKFGNSETVRHLSWRWDSNALLVTCLNGMIGELEMPSMTDGERATYELDLPYKTYGFRRVRKLTTDELVALASDPSVDAAKPTSYNPSPVSTAVSFGEVEVGVGAGPPIVLAALYCCASASCFLVSVGGVHAGAVYKCEWTKPFPVGEFPDDPQGAGQSLTLSHSQKYVLVGNINGKVHLRARTVPFAVLTWELHDQGPTGTPCVAMSFDDTFVLSGGSDGQLSVVRVNPAKIDEAAQRLSRQFDLVLSEGKRTYQVAHDRMAAQNDVRLADEPISNVFLTNPVFVGAKAYVAFMDSVRIVDAETHHGVLRLVDECDPSAFSPAAAIDPNALDDRPKVKEAPDITHKEAYTIQDAKLKLEADIRANSTLAKKNRTRGIIAEMRDQFAKLQEIDARNEPLARLDDRQWNIDPDYLSLLMANGDKLCDEVRKEMAYAYEQSELLLHKMRNKYVGNVAVELITLHGFQNGLHVQSFRTTRMTDELQERLRVIHVEMQELAKNSQPTSEKTYTVLDFIHKPKAEASTDDKPTAGESHKRHSSHVHHKTTAAETIEATSHRFDYRKNMRAERKARTQAWEGKKPKEEADDPRDVAAIAFASSHMQDYKLKTSATYVVPEDQRVNAMKKRKQMALLEEKMYEVAMGFNAKLLELRDLKLRLIEQIQDDNTTIKALDIDLAALRGLVTTGVTHVTPPPLPLFEPQVDLREWPEQRECVLDVHIDEYVKKGTVTTALALPAEFHLGNSSNKATSAATTPKPPVHPVLGQSCVPLGSTYELSTLETEEVRIQCIQLQRQRQALDSKIVHAVQTFDEAIYRLRREKLKLDIALKKGEIKLMTRLGELVLLEQFESKENLLVSKLEKCKTDKAQVVRELTDCSDQLVSKRKDMDECQRTESAVQSEFVALVGLSHPCFGVLQKIFKKRLKRQKKRAADDGDDDDDDESDDEYNSDDDDDDNDSNEEEMCPSGCDMALYEKVLALREKKADVDDVMSEITKAIDDFKRSNDRHIQKQRQIDKELTATEQDIQAFQTEKQMRFNELDVIVALSKHQLRCLQPKDAEAAASGTDPSALYLPETVENALVFNHSVVDRLASRILSLQEENKSLRQVFKDLHKQQSQLLRDKTRQNELIGQVNEKCNQLQLLKFGRLIDIDLLDKACDTGNLNELKTKVRTKEMHGEKQLTEAKGEQQRLKMEILAATQENTRLLTEIALLSERQFDLEKELNQADVNNTLVDDGAQLEKEMSERKKLVQLVKLQSREIDALKQEVLMLRGKKGRVHSSTH
ncbi:hypothetical protein H257_17344 [Aphanomyces astaci]|uniref:EML-like first beta-propeller domain-containing protein n=1 Tax=Aphanomyces astaci TaxID=112090 RepID=W4FH59_APHAT|nr:hypothetical protein H257_17344 [Aphanomyces astaci]ETV66073.1 hypothetical protein H257_17344 [Aphanomyces astaci]|eukprot:XP_009844402.1 hypothetical protein H257_17344 [Aphanomyces astaci]